MNDIMVSIVCNAFNHEKYIKKALDGFIMQKTDFKYEVLIHDDASKDKTADIIREYEKKYPEIIKPVYQTENQYSQGVKISRVYQYPRIQGKYVAVCEGDDFWIDEYKLQKQVDALERHPEVDMCAHRAKLYNRGKYVKSFPNEKTSGILAVDKVISGGGGFVATASLVYRRKLLDEKMEFREFMPYDYTMQILGSLRGGMLYLKDEMSVYNILTENSWSTSMLKDIQRYKKHAEKCIKMLDILNEETCGRYETAVRKSQNDLRLDVIDRTETYEELKNSDMIKHLKSLSFKKRMKLYVKIYFPFIARIVRKIRG